MQDKIFRFKKFAIAQDKCAMKVNTDGVLLGAWSNVKDKKKILDIGTGTGIIALMLAQRTEDALVDAIEIDHNAFVQAKTNFEDSIYTDRIHAFYGPVQDFKSKPKHYDLIITNPPFFTGGALSFNENKTNVRHTVKLSHSDLLRSVQRLLSDEGSFDVILPHIEGLRFMEISSKYNLNVQKVVEVKSKIGKPIERVLISLGKSKKMIVKEQLIIHHPQIENQYSDAFISLTKEFYLTL